MGVSTFVIGKKEHLAVFYLNSRTEVIKREIVSVGTLDAAMVHPREVFENAIKLSAHSVMIAHNHPSGVLSPSEADIRLTSKLVNAGHLLGIEVKDHIIISKTSYESMKLNGFM